MSARSYEKMTELEAQKHLEALETSLSRRLEWMRAHVAGGRGPDLDASPESLVPLWNWVLAQDHDVDAPRSADEDIPPWLEFDAGFCSRLGPRLLALTDGLIAYFAEVASHDLPGARWTVGSAPKSTNYIDQNAPVLLLPGGAHMNPVRMVTVAVVSAIVENNERRRDPEVLLRAYRRWAEPARRAIEEERSQSGSEAAIGEESFEVLGEAAAGFDFAVSMDEALSADDDWRDRFVARLQASESISELMDEDRELIYVRTRMGAGDLRRALVETARSARSEG